MSDLVVCSNIVKTYQQGGEVVRALRGVDLHLQVGSLTAIMGPSGCGKSTLLNIIGLVQPCTSGTLHIDGVQAARLKESVRARMRNEHFGYLVQDFALIEADTVWSNVCVPLLYASRERRKAISRQQIRQLLMDLGIADKMNERVKNLSGGQRQRVALARALVNNPEMILADEPTGQLDSENASLIMELLRNLTTKGKTILLVTHDNDVAACCDSVIQMLEGVLV